MKPIEIERWGKVREQGALRFILVSGVPGWGVPMFILMTFVLNHASVPVPAAAVIWGVGGGCFGAALWRVQERRYRRAMWK